jgi:hypothetical protein
MLLGGLWHGAAWNFVFWGFYHGLLLSAHRQAAGWWKAHGPEWISVPEVVSGNLSRVVMFGFTLYGWLLFRAESFPQIWAMTLSLVPAGVDPLFFSELGKLFFYVGFLLLVQVGQFASKNLEFVLSRPVLQQSAFYLACVYMILILGAYDGPSFIYFQF